MSITNESVQAYLNSIQKDGNEWIDNLRRQALEEKLPIIRNEVKQLLEIILLVQKPKSILEIGTAVGYSSILMSNYLGSDGKITTIERWDEMAVRARQNIKKAGKEEMIEVIEGDAEKILPNLSGSYDLIFMDAAKAQYITFLPHCIRLLKTGGLLISDNVLQDGEISKSRWSIPRRQRTIHARMREYLWEINHNPSLKTVILPISDGLTVSYKLDSVNSTSI